MLTEQDAGVIAGIVRHVVHQELPAVIEPIIKAAVAEVVDQVVERNFWVAGEILAKLGKPVVTAIGEIEKSAGLLVDGQAYFERWLAAQQARLEEGEEWKNGADDSAS